MSWPLDSTVDAGLVALFLGHAWLARRADDARRKHTFYFGLRLGTLWVGLASPLDTFSDHHLDNAHMLQHALVGFVAPPPMILGLTPTTVALLSRITVCGRR